MAESNPNAASAAIAASLTQMGAAFVACADALAGGFTRAIEAQRRRAHVVVCIRAGYASDITDEEAREVLWHRYGHDPMALSAALGDWYTARAHRDLNKLREQLGSRVIAFTGPIDASRLAATTVFGARIRPHTPHLHYEQPPRSPQGQHLGDAVE